MVFSGQHSGGSLERDERDLSFIVKLTHLSLLSIHTAISSSGIDHKRWPSRPVSRSHQVGEETDLLASFLWSFLHTARGERRLWKRATCTHVWSAGSLTAGTLRILAILHIA